MRCYCKGESVTATLENLFLENESHWTGAKGTGYFLSGSYKFHNGANLEYNYFYDCMYSNETATSYSGLQDMWRGSVGKGYDNSENYGVVYPSPGKIDVLNKDNGDIIRGFYVTNTAWAYNAIKNGDGMSDVAGGFQKGDYFKLIIKGLKADGEESQVEYYLADYRSENEADHYALNSWQWVDLKALGEVKSVSFKMEGNKEEQMGAYNTQLTLLSITSMVYVTRKKVQQFQQRTIKLSISRLTLHLTAAMLL